MDVEQVVDRIIDRPEFAGTAQFGVVFVAVVARLHAHVGVAVAARRQALTSGGAEACEGELVGSPLLSIRKSWKYQRVARNAFAKLVWAKFAQVPV